MLFDDIFFDQIEIEIFICIGQSYAGMIKTVEAMCGRRFVPVIQE